MTPQLPGETPKAYGALVSYLQMGSSRTLAALAATLSSSPSYLRQLKAWSTKWEWQRRASEYDAASASIALRRHAEESADTLAPVRLELASLAVRAAGVLRELLDDSSAKGSSTRLQAARAVLELSGVVPPRRGEAAQQDDPRQRTARIVLAELPVDDLRELSETLSRLRQ